MSELVGQIGDLDGLAMAELVRRGEVSARELVEAALARAERLNPSLNAIVVGRAAEARAEADGPLPDSPLAGVPFLLKDLIAEPAGLAHSEGMRFLAGHVAEEDSTLVARQRAAGLIIIGRTNTSELGMLPATESARWGPAHNPWDLARSTSGSSGGSAAAVAAGIVPLAHGNDAGGSLRCPASCCGIFGFKPTRGRNPLGPHYGDLMSGLVQEHGMSWSVRDNAALLDATSGPEVGDPYAAPAHAGSFLAEVEREPGRLRIAFADAAPSGAPVHGDCVAAVREVAALCESLGHGVEEASPTFDSASMSRAFVDVVAAGCAFDLDYWGERTGREARAEDVEANLIEANTWALASRGRRLDGGTYLGALHRLQVAMRAIGRFFEDYDVWLTPTMAVPPLPLGSFHWTRETRAEVAANVQASIEFTQIGNVTGGPAMSLPLHWNAAGLPIGTHFQGRFGDEATLYRLAGQLERARPWRDRRPPIVAEVLGS